MLRIKVSIEWTKCEDIVFYISCTEFNFSMENKLWIDALRNLGWKSDFLLPSYSHRLKLFNMRSLYERREAAMVKFIFKLIKGLTNFDEEL